MTNDELDALSRALDQSRLDGSRGAVRGWQGDIAALLGVVFTLTGLGVLVLTDDAIGALSLVAAGLLTLLFAIALIKSATEFYDHGIAILEPYQ